MFRTSEILDRKLQLPPAGQESFFLWGPRQTGKSTLLRQRYPQPDALWFDLLETEEYWRFLAHPELLRRDLETATPQQQIVIDEVQKVPALLDEVHWLIENRGLHFALCGSNARKLRRSAANLLGGRALRFELRGFSAVEFGRAFNLTRLLNRGTLPHIYLHRAKDPAPHLRAYVADYLKVEVAAEGLVRKLPSFSHFLDIAALSDGAIVNFENIARQCRVSAPTVKNYFEILEDTLLGNWLPAYRKRPSQKTRKRPKFYFGDVGVVNQLAKRGKLEPGGELYGKAFENWVFHELCAFRNACAPELEISYWQLKNSGEVDFILGDMAVAVEVKSSERINNTHMKGLRKLKKHGFENTRRIIVCRERRPQRTTDGIEILPYAEFVERLWRGEFFGSEQTPLF